MKTLDDILMQNQGMTPEIDSVNARDMRRTTKKAILEYMEREIIGEDESEDDASRLWILGRNELRQEQRSKLNGGK